VDPVTRSVRLTADFDNPDEALRPGMFLSVQLQVSARDDAVVVPEEAVVSEGMRHVIFTVKDDRAERRVIRIGQRAGARIEVVEGLKPGRPSWCGACSGCARARR
jgi:membrane fusion protein (multidrug efflux system)